MKHTIFVSVNARDVIEVSEKNALAVERPQTFRWMLAKDTKKKWKFDYDKGGVVFSSSQIIYSNQNSDDWECVDKNTNFETFEYTINLVNKDTKQPISLDPTIKNGSMLLELLIARVISLVLRVVGLFRYLFSG